MSQVLLLCTLVLIEENLTNFVAVLVDNVDIAQIVEEITNSSVFASLLFLLVLPRFATNRNRASQIRNEFKLIVG